MNFPIKQISNNNKYDLEERTAKFGEEIIDCCKSITLDTITRPVVTQLIRSGTSVGANYMEANGASSKKDFRNKIFICKKVSQESKHWLRMIVRCKPEVKEEAGRLWQESQELTMIFQKIMSSLGSKQN